MREDLIMALAEDITMVMILSIVIGLVAGWYFTYLYYHSHDPEVTDLAKRLPPSQLPTPPTHDKCQGCDNKKGCVTCHDGDQYEHSVLKMSDGLVLECRVQINGMNERYLLMHNPVINDNTLNEGDKVKVIIIKKD